MLASACEGAHDDGFHVYRNTVRRGCIDALEANFPAVATLVGAAWFRSAAAHFAEASPPVDARMARYGQGFPAFLASLPTHGDMPYLVDVAHTDLAWSACHDAADAEPLDAHAWLDAWEGRRRWRLHPATRWVASAFPVASLWQASRDGVAPRNLAWLPEAILLTRPGSQPLATPVPPATLCFLEACGAGQPLAAAADHACEAFPTFPIDHAIAAALGAGALALA
ncbi:hypothetical protein VI08_06250 [Luteibacter yeojuensis]|uniref:Putative DNA-binding domain-containing protein n=1 Tax=Luteibacter yeojuensis TaxID=345309 RepID=A0A0F3KYA7_9GAMM|nr:hypothetical protein VI08_06250 [Luteibacter yeojuensis]